MVRILLALAVLSCAFFLPLSDASAFWGKEPETESGLDLSGGFDLNTLTTVSGKVIQPPEKASGKDRHAVLLVEAQQGSVTVVLGPWWYWEKHGVELAKDREITVTGSLAQGKNGAFYLFAQRITDRTTGNSVELRTESGKPMWSRGVSGARGSRLGGRGGGSRGGAMRGGR